MGLLRLEGKRSVIKCAFGLSIFSFVFLFLAFATPYWFQSWPRVYSPFKFIGLWQVCFAGLVLEQDPDQRAYHGCWWILASEFGEIRDWLMPWWFIMTQVFVTVNLLIQGLNLVLQLMIIVVSGSTSHTGTGKRRAPIRSVQTSLVLTIVSACIMTFVVILFGIQVYYDHLWMPYPELNYLSWSYGLAVLTAFFNIFASIAQGVYTRIERQELREPPAQVMGGMMSPNPPAYPPAYPPQNNGRRI